MAIYLDANVLFGWKTFAELDRVALTIVAQQIRQSVVVPEVAAWEAEAHYQRSLEGAIASLVRSHKAAVEAFRGDEVPALAAIDADARVARWRQELRQFAQILAVHADDAAEPYRREAFGEPPAKRVLDEKGRDAGGKGGRDSAIWLAVARDHEWRDEEGHFISKNTSDFGATGELKSALATDLNENSRSRFYNYSSLEDFLALLGSPTRDFEISLDDVRRRLPTVVQVVLPGTPDVPRAVFGSGFDWDRFHYHAEIKDVRPKKVLAARRYEQESDAITVINVECEIVADCLQMNADDEIGQVVVYDGALLEGAVQAYFPDDEERLAQVVSTRLRVSKLPAPRYAIGG